MTFAPKIGHFCSIYFQFLYRLEDIDALIRKWYFYRNLMQHTREILLKVIEKSIEYQQFLDLSERIIKVHKILAKLTFKGNAKRFNFCYSLDFCLQIRDRLRSR